MNYLSVTETAKKWGISNRRVLRLASDGRIDGAFIISNRWLIPEDAVKPQDERKKTEKNNDKKDGYIFPLFFYCIKSEDYFSNNYTQEENNLIKAALLYENYQLEECIDFLEEILPKTDNEYLIISIFFLLTYAYHDSCSYDKAIQAYHKLQFIISQIDLHQDELQFVYQDVSSLFSGVRWYADSFCIDFSKSYSKEFINYLIMEKSIVDMSAMMAGKSTVDIVSDELLCRSVESQGYLYISLFMNFFLSTIYSFLANEDMKDQHLKAVFKSIEQNKLYSSVLHMLTYVPDYESVITEYSSAQNREKLLLIAKNFSKAHTGFHQYLGLKNAYLNLSLENYRFLSYVLKGYSRKQMMEIENTSLYKVKKSLCCLYNYFSVESRKELIEKAHNEFIDF